MLSLDNAFLAKAARILWVPPSALPSASQALSSTPYSLLYSTFLLFVKLLFTACGLPSQVPKPCRSESLHRCRPQEPAVILIKLGPSKECSPNCRSSLKARISSVHWKSRHCSLDCIHSNPGSTFHRLNNFENIM